MARLLMKLLFPPACPICAETYPQRLTDDGIGAICEHCEKKVIRVQAPFCMRCGKPLSKAHDTAEYCEDCRHHTHDFTQGRAAFLYRGEMIGCMHRLKYKNRRDYAPILADEAYRMHADWIARIRPDAIIPVPLHPDRKRARGYNQALLLARQISRKSGIPLEERLLFRTQNTEKQRSLDPAQRKKNLKNAFQTIGKIVQLEKVLLIDDIYTTGSTADAAARALISAGVRQVYLLCICIGGEQGE